MTLRRRPLIACGVDILAVPIVFSQVVPRVYRVGVMSRGSSSGRGSGTCLYFGALQKLRYTMRRNLVIECWFSEGQEDRLASLAADLVASKVDVIIAAANPETLVAKRATTVIPIVMLFSFVPVELGLIASLAHPGANITGTTIYGAETPGRTLQVLRDTVPGAKRVATLLETNFPGFQHAIPVSNRAAAAMGIQTILLPVHSVEELEAAFAHITRERPDALWIVLSGVINQHRARIIEFAARQRLPAIYSEKFPVSEGGLISYTFNTDDLLRRAADITDRVLKGTSAGDIPVEQPTRFDLAINLKTARALGLTIPRLVLLQATEVIE